MSGFISFRRPEAGTVRCQHLVADHHITILVQTEFKLGIRNNNTLAQGIFRTLFIQRDGIIPQPGSVFLTLAGEALLQVLHTLLIGDIFIVVSDLRLG